MKTDRGNSNAFTLTEVMVVAAVTVIIAMSILTYATMATRMIYRNLTVNHSHDVVRASLERMLYELHNSASQFTLFDVSITGGTTTYTDVTPTYTGSSDTDAYYVSYLINDNRANGVRFFIPAGTGPYQLTGDGVTDSGTVSPTSTTLEFDFKNSGYVPSAGDVLQMPLIYSGEYVVQSATATTGTKYKVTLNQATGYYLYTGTSTTNTNISYNSSNPANTAGYFYTRRAYAVVNNQLNYYPNFTDPTSAYPCTWNAASTDVPVLIRENVASIAPFSLLVSGTSASTTGLYTLRVSLVSYDLQYSARAFQNSDTTILSIIPPRTITDSETTLSTNTR